MDSNPSDEKRCQNALEGLIILHYKALQRGGEGRRNGVQNVPTTTVGVGNKFKVGSKNFVDHFICTYPFKNGTTILGKGIVCILSDKDDESVVIIRRIHCTPGRPSVLFLITIHIQRYHATVEWASKVLHPS